jgi:hypothetical protein
MQGLHAGTQGRVVAYLAQARRHDGSWDPQPGEEHVREEQVAGEERLAAGVRQIVAERLRAALC